MTVSLGRLWMWLLPALFLPNLGLARQTAFGRLELSDYLIVPLIVALIFAPTTRVAQRSITIERLFATFILWATAVTLMIPGRYGYTGNYQLEFGLLKLAKLTLYIVAGLLVARALRHPDARARYPLTIALCAGAAGLSLIMVMGSEASDRDPTLGFSAANATSVMMAILLTFIVGIWVDKGAGGGSRLLIGVLALVAVYGFAFTEGRGGWVAAVAGLGVIGLARLRSVRTWLVIVAGIAAFAGIYATQPAFQRQVDDIFRTEGLQDAAGNALETPLPFNDGARLLTWNEELRKVARAPILGTGFYHRGGSTGLFSTGSHNFFIQMFLETGIVGGGIWVALVVVLWRHAADAGVWRLSTRAALIAATVGGLSGEYFYGGMVLLAVLLVYAPIGALPRSAPGRAPSPARALHHDTGRATT